MTLTERQRHDAYEAMQRTFGDNTDIVIAMFQPDHEQLATKDDVVLTRAELRTEMGEVRTEVAELRTELKTEMADLRSEFRTDMANLQTAIERRITDGFQHQIRSMILTIMGAVVLVMLASALQNAIA